MYTDFQFYTNEYHGGATEADYTRLAVRATAIIDRMTNGRAATATGADLTAVKMAECAVVDELGYLERGGDITSESNDGISRSYASGTVVKTKTQRLYSAAETWLATTNLCFAGV